MAVVGITTALVIPAVMINTNDLELKAGLKKAYADLTQASMMIMAENNGTMANLCPSLTGGDAADCFMEKYADNIKYFNKYTKAETVATPVIPADTTYLDGDSSLYTYLSVDPLIIDKSGNMFTFEGYANTPTTYAGSDGISYYGKIFVDTNGFKGPNTLGKDIFSFWVLENEILPMGLGSDRDGYNPATNCTSSGKGHACTAEYLD